MSKKSLDILFPVDKEKIIGGQKFIIREFRVKELSDVVALGVVLTGQNGLASVLETDPDRLFRLISSTTEVPVATIEKMRLAALAEVVALIVEANADFFGQLPALINRVTGVVVKTNGAKLSAS